MSIISPLRVRFRYRASSDISLQEVTLDMIGWGGRPSYKAVFSSLPMSFLEKGCRIMVSSTTRDICSFEADCKLLRQSSPVLKISSKSSGSRGQGDCERSSIKDSAIRIWF